MKLMSGRFLLLLVVLVPASGFLLKNAQRYWPQGRQQQQQVNSKTCYHLSARAVVITRIRSHQSALMSKQTERFDEEELEKMKEMIVSLSLEPTDEERRERLKNIFDEQLGLPNGGPKHFTEVFDQALIIVGDRVKLEAQEFAMKLQHDNEARDFEHASEGNKPESEDASTSPAFPQQRQLWALVDMMVQSKTIVKRSTGELGSKGTFQ